ncbi:hypothetical protein [Streptomyces sp. NPDC086776]|uniref:hypothetical protein n=1 Tax=Streptomyces sp. NPDC086776 TaxID=3365756 RepID=UPI00380316E8
MSRKRTDAWINASCVGANEQNPDVARVIWLLSGEIRFNAGPDALSAQQRRANLFLANGQLPSTVDVSGDFRPTSATTSTSTPWPPQPALTATERTPLP